MGLHALDGKVTIGQRVRFVGFVDSNEMDCRTQQAVQIRRRFVGAPQFRLLLTAHTDSIGRFEAAIRPTRSSEYKAKVRWTPECDVATSSHEPVFVRVKVTATPSDYIVPQGGFFTIAGAVRPGHRGSHVIVQRRTPRGWVKVEKVGVRERSRYSTVLVVGWEGERTFRVRWPAQDHDHEPNTSRIMTLRTS